uniref:Sulfotransferase n=1 Tax=Aegilops tauschii TaxID=37682 RepID=R7WBQ3_AEGTA
MLYSTVHRREHPAAGGSGHPLNSLGPHECVKFLEYQLYVPNQIPGLDELTDPSLFATHAPFVSLPGSVPASGCKVVYVCRDPKDALVSQWSFVNKYEEMSQDPAACVRKLAEFIGRPFAMEEEEEAGAVDAIVNLCSFDHMTALDNSWFFRRGLVGDWKNHLSPETARRIDAITKARFKDRELLTAGAEDEDGDSRAHSEGCPGILPPLKLPPPPDRLPPNFTPLVVTDASQASTEKGWVEGWAAQVSGLLERLGAISGKFVDLPAFNQSLEANG